MEDSFACKDHGNPLQLICVICKELICYRCVKVHTNKGCTNIIDLPAYAEDLLTPKIKAQIEDFDKRKSSIEASTKEFSILFESMLIELIKLKEKIVTLLDQINKSIELLTNQAKNFMDTNELSSNPVKKYEFLMDSIQKQDIKSLIKLIRDQDNNEVIKTGDSEKILINSISKATFTLINTKEFEILSNSLKELVKNYKVLASANFSEVNSKFVYNVCEPMNECGALCRYNIETRKISKLTIDVPQCCTISQIKDRIYLSGGYNPYVNTLSEYIESSKKLENKSPMIYQKYEHSIEITSSNKFVTIGGYSGECITYCEEYSINENKWDQFPSLNIARRRFGTSLIKGSYLYAIGGVNSNNSIEVIDIGKKKSWEFVKISLNELSFIDNAWAFPTSDDEIIIMCGDNTTDIGKLDISSSKITKLPNLSLTDYYLFNSKCVIQGDIYTIGYYGHIHIYHSNFKIFEEIKYSSAYS